jgi:hypothetical protein
MFFNSSNFLVPYAPNDKVLQFRNSFNLIVGGVNVCSISSITCKEDTVQIDVDLISVEYKLKFSTDVEAKNAAQILQTALNALLPNCAIGISLPPAPTAQLIRTYTQFRNEALSNQLSPNTVYQVTTTNNEFSLGNSYVFYVTPQFSNQTYFGNCEAVNGDILEIDINTNNVVSRHIGTLAIKEFNSSVIYSGTNLNLDIKNSNLSLTDVTYSSFINTTGNFNNCTNLVVENCNGLDLASVTNSEFYNITGNYTSYSFNNVIVDPRIPFVGKVGVLTGANSNITYTAFIDPQNIIIPTLTSNRTWNINNPFSTVNAAFYFHVPQTGIGSGVKLTIEDGNTLNTITEITSQFAGSVVQIGYNINTDEWELISQFRNSFTNNITVSFNGQTTFTNIANYPIIEPAKTSLFVNGQRQRYASDYTIINTTLTWTSSSFSLETTDEVILTIGTEHN